jgi:hypothetical protein
VTGVGGASRQSPRMVGEQRAAEFDEQLEVLSLVGDVALQDDKPVVHAHLIVGRRDGPAYGVAGAAEDEGPGIGSGAVSLRAAPLVCGGAATIRQARSQPATPPRSARRGQTGAAVAAIPRPENNRWK